jgi:epoxyqueuosine reductase
MPDFMPDLNNIIKEQASLMGFAACGIAKAERLQESEVYFKQWLDAGFHDGLTYMERNFEKRMDPTLLVDGAKSVIVVLVPYNKVSFVNERAPRIARYAQGIDYHDSIRQKLYDLLNFICQYTGDSSVSGRAFADSAPVLERKWAVKAGLGWQGKNSLLLNKKLGSYFFIAELILNIELPYDNSFNGSFCGQCNRCINACPAKAIEAPGIINAGKCISYRTIEQKQKAKRGDESLHGWLFGCDACQEVCPWNVKPLNSRPEWLKTITEWPVDKEEWLQLTEVEFNSRYGETSLSRTGYERLMANLDLL